MDNILSELNFGYWETKAPPEEPPKKPIRKYFFSEDERRNYILEPLEEVILHPSLLDDIIVRYAVPDLLEGREPSYSGVILFGPPSTGKR